MKRLTTILTVALGLLLVLAAAPAAAKKPPKPPGAASLAIYMHAEPVWVHEDADHLRYTVTIENKTSEEVTGIAVQFTAAIPTVEVSVPSISANGSDAVGFSRHVSEFPEAAECGPGEQCPLPAAAVVFRDGVPVAQAEMSTPLLPVAPCDLDESGSALVDDLCIWTLPTIDGSRQYGVWEISLLPTRPDNPNRPVNATVTVRDGVPGNWCTLAIGTSSAFGGRWRVGDDPIVGEVYLPGDENLETLGLDEGMCLGGGAGGDYFEVGNPASFYLRADGEVTVKWVRRLP